MLCDFSSILGLIMASCLQLKTDSTERRPKLVKLLLVPKWKIASIPQNWSVCHSAPLSLDLNLCGFVFYLFCFHCSSEGVHWQISNTFSSFKTNNDENDELWMYTLHPLDLFIIFSSNLSSPNSCCQVAEQLFQSVSCLYFWCFSGTVAELHPISTKEVEDQPLLKGQCQPEKTIQGPHIHMVF